MYDIFEKECIKTVYHSGDISEGERMRPGHEYECFLHGADEIEQYIIKNYPKRNGIKTYFITGNHDISTVKACGHDMGTFIANKRDDMTYLGMLNAKINLTPNCVVELNHPLDGGAYALSYSIQKYIDSMTGGEKPSILINGHHHKAMSLFYRNIHAIEAATFEAQSAWMKGKRLAAHVGGYIITVHVDDEGHVNRFIPEFIPFYEMIKEDY
jgi:UDP-2,3-diacylglucosamine pyrophosphatase LpxH